MTPSDMLAACTKAINSWNAGEQLTEKPIVSFAFTNPNKPTGKTIRLFRDRGPRGDLILVRPQETGGWKIVAHFPAVALIEFLAKEMGVPSPVKQARRDALPARAKR